MRPLHRSAAALQRPDNLAGSATSGGLSKAERSAEQFAADQFSADQFSEKQRAADHASLIARALATSDREAFDEPAVDSGKLPPLGTVLQTSGAAPLGANLAAQDRAQPATPREGRPSRLPAAGDRPSDDLVEAVESSSAVLDDPRRAEPLPAGVAAEELPLPPGQSLLDLQTVLVSTTQTFPSVREATELLSEALGDAERALGEFDDRLEGFTINQPLGFYENYRHGISWSRPLETGGLAYTGYRIGRGNFEPWYGGRDTDNSGEFRVGFEIPLLQNRVIDPRRTAVRLAALDVQRSSPELFQQILSAQSEAAQAYWQWVAVGQQYEIAEELMRLAEVRVESIQQQIDVGDVAAIVGIDNRRLLAQRRSLLIEARRRWDTATVRLSLYYRDAVGVPIAVGDEVLPPTFPALPSPPADLETEIAQAMDLRPELAILRISGEQLRAELRLAINQQLPEVGLSTEASKDVGPLTSPSGDKRPFVLETGLIGSVPVQRRRALGRARSLRARLAQLDARTQLTADQIANEIRQATIAYEAARRRLEQATLGKELARETLRAGEIAFAEGEIDILLLNIYEQAYADAGSEVIEAQAAMHIAAAQRLVARGETLLAPSGAAGR